MSEPMTKEQFELVLMLGSWERFDCEHFAADEIFKHHKNIVSIGVKEGSEEVAVYISDDFMGMTSYEEAMKKVQLYEFLADAEVDYGS